VILGILWYYGAFLSFPYPTAKLTLPLVGDTMPSNSTEPAIGDRTRLLCAVPFVCKAVGAWLVKGIGLAPRLELAGLRILPEAVIRGLPGIAVAAFSGTGRAL
jgi:hypothetical protein